MRLLLRRVILPVYFLFWTLYFGWFWSHAFQFDTVGNLFANHVNLWGDWAAHFTMGLSLAYRSLWLTQSPFLLGAKFSYPYAANWLAAVFIKMGVPFLTSFTLLSFGCSMLMIFALYYFFNTVFKSSKIAIIASLLFLLNGGLGFVYFGKDISASSQPLSTFLNPPHEYTRLDSEHIKWISVIDSMMIPQRAFALGFPLTLIALALIYQATKTPHHSQKKILVAGLLLGLMPLIHTHSFLAAGIILSFWMLGDLIQHRKNWRLWLTLGCVTLSIAVPISLYFFANQVHGFIKWYPGWLASEFSMNWLLFWFKNWAFMPLLAVIGWGVWMKKSTKHFTATLVFAPFFFLFVIANLWLFQPFSWDNTKLFVWASIGFSGLAAYLFHTQFKTLIGKSIVTILFLVTIASGSIDAYRILRTDLHTYQMYSSEEVALAEWVKQETPINAVWLTGTQHNHWLFNLTGRQAVMTYPGWLWTYGYDFYGTEADVRHLYQLPESTDIINKYRISYIVVGPSEIQDLQADKASMIKHYQVIKETENYVILETGIK